MRRPSRRSPLSYLCSCALLKLTFDSTARSAFTGVQPTVPRVTRPTAAGQKALDWIPRLSQGNESQLLVGQQLPKIVLPDQDGKNIAVCNRDPGSFSFNGKRTVLFFFGGPISPLCEREVGAFRDRYANFTALGTEVFGVSRDSADALREFRQKEGLPFSLLSDKDGNMREMLRIPRDLLIDGRQTFVIGRDGVIEKSYNNQLEPETHVDESLASVTEIFAADQAFDVAEARRLAEQQLDEQQRVVASIAEETLDSVGSAGSAALKLVADAATRRVEGVGRDTGRFLDEVKSAPGMYGELARAKAAVAAENMQRQVEAARLASQERLLAERLAAQVALQDQAFGVQDSVRRKLNDTSHWLQDLPLELQKSAQVRATELQLEAEKQIEEVSVETQRRIKRTVQRIVEAPSIITEQAQRQANKTASSILGSIQESKDRIQQRVEETKQTALGLPSVAQTLGQEEQSARTSGDQALPSQDKVQNLADVEALSFRDEMRKASELEAEVAASEAAVKITAPEAAVEKALPQAVERSKEDTEQVPKAVERPKVDMEQAAIEEAARILGLPPSELAAKLRERKTEQA